MISIISLAIILIIMFIFIVGSFYNAFNLQYYENDKKALRSIYLLFIIGVGFAIVIMVG